MMETHFCAAGSFHSWTMLEAGTEESMFFTYLGDTVFELPVSIEPNSPSRPVAIHGGLYEL